jgi:hypothetical protein
MLNYIKKKFMAFSDIFKDDNSYNEKNIVGFASFAVMSIFAAADIVTGILGMDLVISDTIFNSFVIIVLGSFGIDGATKIFSKENKEEEQG